MLVQLIDTPLDRTIELVREGQRVRRSVLEDYLEPTYLQFQSAHEGYLSTFSTYRSLLESSVQFDHNHPVFGQIEKDGLYSFHRRADLQTLLDLCDTKRFGPFISAIVTYLGDGYPFAKPPSNIVHAALDDQLHVLAQQGHGKNKSLAGIEVNKEAMKIVDLFVTKLQENYAMVAREYVRAKGSLIG